ncbi:MAG: NlpC/P60 family protein [Bacteroidota bacterium]
MITHGICNLTVVPLRKDPSHQSEMVSQVLFGEHFEVLEKSGDWFRVVLAFDLYQGWIQSSQFIGIDFEEFTNLNNEPCCVSFDIVQLMFFDDTVFNIVLGSSLPHFKEMTCRLGSTAYRFEGSVKCPEKLLRTQGIIENAYMYLNSPYLWGGRTHFGIDCSGLTQMVFKLCGMRLRRDAWQQAEQGSLVHLVDEARPGDLAFFDNEEGRITHVGIILSGGKIIHSSGKVRIDNLDHHGIFNNETKKYSHKLRLIKRFV